MDTPFGGGERNEPFTFEIEIVEKAESPFGPLPTEPSAEFSGIFDGVASTPDIDHDNERFTSEFLERNAERLPGKPIRFIHQVTDIGRVLKSVCQNGILWVRAGIFKKFPSIFEAIKQKVLGALSVGGFGYKGRVKAEKGIKTYEDGEIDEVSVAPRGKNPFARIFGWIAKAENADKVSKELLVVACLGGGLSAEDAEKTADLFHKALLNLVSVRGESMNQENTKPVEKGSGETPAGDYGDVLSLYLKRIDTGYSLSSTVYKGGDTERNESAHADLPAAMVAVGDVLAQIVSYYKKAADPTEVDKLKTEMAAKEKEITELTTAKDKEVADLKTAKDKELADLTTAKDKELTDLKTAKDKEIADLTTAKDKEIAELKIKIPKDPKANPAPPTDGKKPIDIAELEYKHPAYYRLQRELARAKAGS